MGRYNSLLISLSLAAFVLAGCGNGSQSSPIGPQPGKTTQINVLVSSSANNRLSLLRFSLDSLSLTNKAGKTVNLLSSPELIEFMHLNGNPEPLISAKIPQGYYVSAGVTDGGGSFVCTTQQPGTIASAEYPVFQTSKVTVSSPSLLTVKGSEMTLLLNLDVSKSVTFPQGCYDPSNDTFSSSPTFALSVFPGAASGSTPVAGAPAPANPTLRALDGVVTQAGSGGSFQVLSADGTATMLNPPPSPGVAEDIGVPWQVTANSNTVYQGISSFADLAPGMAVDMDGTLQNDGSISATRIAVTDPSTTALSVDRGAVVSVSAANPVIAVMQRQSQGPMTYFGTPIYYSYGSATFGIWGGLTNLSSLPFTPIFDAADMVAGQDVSMILHSTQIQPYPVYSPVTSVTLMPQTIDATISATGSSGGFTTYTVTLAPYDAFPQFAVQGGQTTLLKDPTDVVVYADSNTQMFNQKPLTAGSPARFTGVIFNDNGTLRMDCIAVNDGVAI